MPLNLHVERDFSSLSSCCSFLRNNVPNNALYRGESSDSFPETTSALQRVRDGQLPISAKQTIVSLARIFHKKRGQALSNPL